MSEEWFLRNQLQNKRNYDCQLEKKTKMQGKNLRCQNQANENVLVSGRVLTDDRKCNSIIRRRSVL